MKTFIQAIIVLAALYAGVACYGLIRPALEVGPALWITFAYTVGTYTLFYFFMDMSIPSKR